MVFIFQIGIFEIPNVHGFSKSSHISTCTHTAGIIYIRTCLLTGQLPVQRQRGIRSLWESTAYYGTFINIMIAMMYLTLNSAKRVHISVKSLCYSKFVKAVITAGGRCANLVMAKTYYICYFRFTIMITIVLGYKRDDD